MKIDNKPMTFKKESSIKETWRRLKKDKLAVFGLVVISVFILLAIFSSFIVPYDKALEMDLTQRLATPSAGHIFGCDGFGRDLFARCLHGARTSLFIGFFSGFSTCIIGSLLGAMVGYLGGKFDAIVMRILDIFSSIPSMLFAMVWVAAFGSSTLNICFAIILTAIPAFVRLVRSSVMGIAEMEYIEACKAGGTPMFRVLVKHIIPNAVGTIIVQLTADIASQILIAATLSFLGLGINPPQPEWGSMVSEGKEYLFQAAHLTLIPGALICISAFSMSVLGDGLRDALDPRLKA